MTPPYYTYPLFNLLPFYCRPRPHCFDCHNKQTLARTHIASLLYPLYFFVSLSPPRFLFSYSSASGYALWILYSNSYIPHFRVQKAFVFQHNRSVIKKRTEAVTNGRKCVEVDDKMSWYKQSMGLWLLRLYKLLGMKLQTVPRMAITVDIKRMMLLSTDCQSGMVPAKSLR